MIEVELLDRPAQLIHWSANGGSCTAIKSEAFARLRDAITAARSSAWTSATQPWVVTIDGDLLSPTWLKSQAIVQQQAA